MVNRFYQSKWNWSKKKGAVPNEPPPYKEKDILNSVPAHTVVLYIDTFGENFSQIDKGRLRLNN